MEPLRIGLYTQRNRLISPLIYTVNISAESLVRARQYRNTAEGTDGEIQRYLSVKISKETSGGRTPPPFSYSEQVAMCASTG